jgi:excinuclease ABC subunit A
LNEGAIVATEWSGPREEGGYYWQMLEAVAPFTASTWMRRCADLPEEKLDVILYGTGGQEVTVHYRNREGRRRPSAPFEGVITNLERRYQRNQLRIHPRARSQEFMSERTARCARAPACARKRWQSRSTAPTSSR